jgi:hypothetical protein
VIQTAENIDDTPPGNPEQVTWGIQMKKWQDNIFSKTLMQEYFTRLV